MNMAQAKEQLMKLAKGGYHSMEYTIDDHGEGKVSQKCKVYLPDFGHFQGAQWDSALAQLEAAMGGQPTISEALPISTPSPKEA